MSKGAAVCAALLLATHAAGIVAQEPTVRVAVRVSADTLSVANALVRAGVVSGRTDERGEAILTIARGPASVVVSKIGFLPDSLSFDARNDTTLLVRLVEQPVSVAPVFVTSTRVERRIEEEPLRIEVLTGDDVGEKSEMRPADARTLLSEMSGVRMQTLSPLGATNVRIQGLPGRYTAVLTDGLPLFGGQPSGFTLVEVVPLDLRQAEVIKGAASALYGSQALAGVVDLISRRPPDTSQVLVNESTPQSTDVMGFLARSLGGATSLTALGGIHGQASRDDDRDGWNEVPGFRRVELRPRLFFDDSAGHSLMVTAGGLAEGRASGTSNRLGIGTGAPFAQGAGPREPFADSVATRHGDVGAVGQWHLAPTLTLNARTSATDETRRHRFGAAVEDDARHTLFGELSATHARERNVAVAGVAWLRDSYTNRPVARFDAMYSTPGVFAQDTYTPVHALSGTVNGRCDWSNVYGNICTPRVSVLVRANTDISARVSAGAGWYAPRPLTDQTETFGLSRVFVPEPLAAEHARTSSVDVTWTHGPVQVNGTLFDNQVANAVGLRRVAGDTTGAVNLVNAAGPLRARGGELFAVFDQEPFIVTAYYAATRSREVSTESGARREVPLTPRETAGIDFAADDDESGAYAAMEVFYTGRQSLEDNPYATISRPYTTIGVLLSKRWARTTVFLNGENLSNVRLTKYQPLLRPRVGEGGAWTVEPWAPLEGRRVNLGVKWAWP